MSDWRNTDNYPSFIESGNRREQAGVIAIWIAIFNDFVLQHWETAKKQDGSQFHSLHPESTSVHLNVTVLPESQRAMISQLDLTGAMEDFEATVISFCPNTCD